MGVAGESGCGKSTLGKSLIRLDGRMQHVAGTVELDGVTLPIADDEAMSKLPVHRGLAHPAVRDERAQPDPQDRPADRRPARVARRRPVGAARELERRLDARRPRPDVLNRYPIELSGGMKQRMVMVLSTLLDPSLLIADEVTSALDVSTQRAVAETLVEFRDRGFVKSMIVVTHDISLVYQIADTIMVMYAGQAGREGARRRRRQRAPAPVHPAADLVAARGRRPVRASGGSTGIPGRPPALLEPAHRLPVPRPLPAGVDRVRRGAAVRRGRPRPPGRVLEGGRDADGLRG